MKVTVMGLGLHGGGLESARYLAGQGAEVTVTDLRDETVLAPSIAQLEASGLSFRYVLGRHEDRDFSSADMVLKNPGVRPDSPYLALARRVETDISLFCAVNPGRLTAVTGSKGKSGVASAIHYTLNRAREAGILAGGAFLGGNITVSPLTFLSELNSNDNNDGTSTEPANAGEGSPLDVVLELSSWQLGDLAGRTTEDGRPLLKPRAAVITAILPDHLDRYGSMDAYVADKRIIYRGQDAGDVTAAFDDEWGRSFLAETPARPLPCAESPLPADTPGGWLENGAGFIRLAAGGPVVRALPAEVRVPGAQQKHNLLLAALALVDLGLPPAFVAESLARFPGIEHRLEFFYEKGGVRFYNDTAATIPEAAAAAIEAFPGRLVLVTGGTDKNLDFGPLVRALARAWDEGRLAPPLLLAGTGSGKLKPALGAVGVPYQGPFDNLDAAVRAALDAAQPGSAVVLSPGCASFGMFLNEFDRGRKWKAAIAALA